MIINSTRYITLYKVCCVFHCCLDVDECLSDNGGCEHTCQNTAGSYHCFCEFGNRLAEDRHSCIRKYTMGGTVDISYCMWCALGWLYAQLSRILHPDWSITTFCGQRIRSNTTIWPLLQNKPHSMCYIT